MNLKRIWVMFRARNMEFFRDRAAFGWNFLFPFLIVGGFAVIFGGDTRSEYKVGVFPYSTVQVNLEEIAVPDAFKETRYLDFIGFPSREAGLTKLRDHKIDFLIQVGSSENAYWVSEGPKGYVVEQLFNAALVPEAYRGLGLRGEIEGRPVKYIDWLFPGILAMNMMFSALWGVGFVIVRYRKNGVLKRLKATPLTAVEYLTAQMFSRIFVLMFTLAVMWFGCELFFGFEVRGSRVWIFLAYFLGGLCLTALGMIVAARGISEEFASGVINFIGLPMMFLSEVWFSLEGAPRWVHRIAEVFPLTHVLRAVRRVMNEGAGLAGITPELTILSALTLGFLMIGAFLFSWNE